MFVSPAFSNLVSPALWSVCLLFPGQIDVVSQCWCVNDYISILALFQINIPTLEELSIPEKTRSIHSQHNVCFQNSLHRAVYLARYNLLFPVANWMHLQLSLPGAKIQMIWSSRTWNRRHLIVPVTVYIICFHGNFRHHKNRFHIIEALHSN